MLIVNTKHAFAPCSNIFVEQKKNTEAIQLFVSDVPLFNKTVQLSMQHDIFVDCLIMPNLSHKHSASY